MTELVALTILVAFAATAVGGMLLAEYGPVGDTRTVGRHRADGPSTSQRLAVLAAQARRLVEADRAKAVEEQTERIPRPPFSPWCVADGLADEWIDERELVAA